MTIKATKPTSMKQAFGRVQDYLNDAEADYSHLTPHEQEELFRDFAMAVHYLGRDVIHHNRHFYSWLADRLLEDFPQVANYDADGNWVGAVANENGWTA